VTPSTQSSRIHLTTRQAAELLGLSPRTLEGMRVRGTGPRFFKYGEGKGARVGYAASEVRSWARRCKFRSTAEYGGGRSAGDGSGDGLRPTAALQKLQMASATLGSASGDQEE